MTAKIFVMNMPASTAPIVIHLRRIKQLTKRCPEDNSEPTFGDEEGGLWATKYAAFFAYPRHLWPSIS